MDPDVAAAFGNTPTSPPQQPLSVSDPDVAAAFSSTTQPLKPPDPYISRKTDQPVESETPLGEAVNAYNKWWGGKLAGWAQGAGVNNPQSLGYVRNIPAAAETVLGSYRPAGLPQVGAPPGVGVAEHPLAQAARAVQADVDSLNQQAGAAGFDVGNRTVSPAVQKVNHLGRQDLQLPTLAENGVQAPLYPEMLHAGNKEYVSPPYDAVRAYPKPIQLSPATQATFKDVSPLLTPAERSALPEGDTIMPAQAVDLSIALRGKANQIPDTGINTTTMQTWQSIGKAHMDAARSLESDVHDTLDADGQEQLADDWNDARVYRAKSAAYEHSLDGAGNIRATDLRNQLVKQGVPLTGNARLIAHVAAQVPEQFRGTPQAPQPGFIKSTLAKVAPAAGAVVGAASPLGPIFGSAAGVVGGERIADKLLKP